MNIIVSQVFAQVPGEESRYSIFQQNSAPAHKARVSPDALGEVFRGRVVLA